MKTERAMIYRTILALLRTEQRPCIQSFTSSASLIFANRCSTARFKPVGIEATRKITELNGCTGITCESAVRAYEKEMALYETHDCIEDVTK